MTLEFDASPEEMKLFLEEADEHIQTLEEDLVKLEKEDNKTELLQRIFRASHTLKGSSATLGHQRMAQLTHAMENILDKLRKDQLELTTGVVDALFEGLDMLRILKDELIALEESDVDLVGMLAQLGEVANASPGTGSVPVSTGQASPTADPVTPNGEKVSFDMNWQERDHIQQSMAASGKRAIACKICFSEESEMLAVRVLITMMTMRELGEIIKSEPSEDQIEREEVANTLKVLLLTDASEAKIHEAIQQLPDIKECLILPYSIVAEESVDQFSHPIEPAAATLANFSEEHSSAVAKDKAKSNPKPKTAVKETDTKVNKPSRTVRVDVELLDNLMNLVGELVIDRTRLAQILSNLEAQYSPNDLTDDLNRTSVHIGRVTTQLQEEIMKARMLPVESLFNKFPRMMRDLSQKSGKEVEFVMEGQETELDRSIIEEIGDPLIHLLRNAVDHAIELPVDREASGKSRKGLVKLSAHHEENHINIVVKDDGRGIDSEKVKISAVKKGLINEETAKRLSDQEAINLIFASGLSTVTKVTDVSGRGVGMDVVRNNLEKVNGAIEIKTEVGKGTEFKIKLPLTLAIIRALLVSLNCRVYAIPLTAVLETIRITSDQIKIINKHEAIVVRGNVLPLVRLRELFSRGDVSRQEGKIFVVVVNLAGQQMGLVVDSLIGEQEVVIKSLGKFIGDVQGVAGATILGDGSVALIVDVPSLMKKLHALS